MEIQPGTIIDRYEVLDQIGEGGMAIVYRARHRTLGSLHALKVLTVESPSVRERLIREGQVQATLAHPNIVPVTDVIDVNGAPGLIMQFIAGPSLERWLAQSRGSLAEGERLFEGVLAAMEHAHGCGVVHRDLKPGNVLLQPVTGGFLPRVADFGLARALNEEGANRRTRGGVAMGTPSYMAPEQIRDARSADHRADVFALGCILYEIATGTLAFGAEDLLDLFNAIATENYVPPAERVPDLPPRVSAAIRGALAVRLEDRIQDVRALREVLSGSREWSTEVPRFRGAAPAGRKVVSAPPTFHDEPPDASSVLPVRAPAAARPRATLLATAVAALAVVAIGALAWPDPPTPSVAVAPPAAAPTGEVVPTPAPSTLPPQVVAPPPSPAPATVEIETRPKPPAPAPRTATWSAQGADRVELVGDAGTFAPGPVPPGTYVIRATFGEKSASAGSVTLGAGDRVSLTCDADFRECR